MILSSILAQPAGVPGLAALVAGGAVFFAAVIRAGIAAAAGGGGGKKSAASRVGIALQMLGFACTGFGPTRFVLLAASPAALAIGAAVALLMGLAIASFVAATRAMGANWSVAARMRDDHQLVTWGIFGRMRHPIYAGMALFLLALALALGHEAQLAAGIPLFALGTALRVRVEERLLRDRFGGAYEEYAGRIGRFLPSF
jgi:protein-S-isoprenylcysteine O-methyltransferase Ste14